MGFDWIPNALKNLNNYSDERFWGILMFFMIVIVVTAFAWSGKK